MSQNILPGLDVEASSGTTLAIVCEYAANGDYLQAWWIVNKEKNNKI
jgi:hypothetical protein